MAVKLASVYNPQTVEDKWYTYWRDNNFFVPDPDENKPTFSIVMPPPNVTGQLHLGHALDNTLQDILSRFHRMQGYSVLWLPGTDHAGIATQAKVEESLRAEDLSRFDLGREKFLEKVWEWKELYGGKITKQLSLLGSSCDWSRERFTMDEGCSLAVRKVFVDLYKKGLIYQGNYIVNWCPHCQTAISDIEVEHADEQGCLWHIRYPLALGGYVVVATTRPETMLGDTGIAVNPSDERYQNLIGQTAVLPLCNREIPVFADEYVDPTFGTGAVKVTPAHDPNDFDMGRRHGLPELLVIDEAGYMNENAGTYKGLERDQARRQIVADLEAGGYLVQVEEHEHTVGHCQRCATIIEPLVSKQWFVKMKPLAEPAIKAVVDGDVKFVPERFTHIYLSWMENIRDWCISRQLWWGHRIPVWYCQKCGKIICQMETPEICPHCQGDSLKQDEDVLDTWFSSALWPFSTMGWPANTDDYHRFYPTSVLVTGRDIIFFWVARMIFSGLEHTGQVPFYDVNVHGLILDKAGRKMSKSLGNGIDPIDVINKYGADTLRFALITGVKPGNDFRFHWEKVENIRNFANKIWNAARFCLLNLDDYQPLDLESDDLSLADRWILHALNEKIVQITELLDQYDLGDAAQQVYEFIWDDFCDWYIELAKSALFDNQEKKRRRVTQEVLYQSLLDILKLLYPFMPFISEEIYHFLPGAAGSLMLSQWPQERVERRFLQAKQDMMEIMEIIRAVRNIRADFNVNPGQKVQLLLVAKDDDSSRRLEENRDYLLRMANLSDLQISTDLLVKSEQTVSALTEDVEIYVPLAGLLDTDKELARLRKEIEKTDKEIQQSANKLKNKKFVANAPAEVVAKEQERLQASTERREGLLKRMGILQQN